MTGREIIKGIVDSCFDLDKEIPLFLLERDEYNCVIDKHLFTIYNVINGKIYVEDNSYKKE